MNLVSLAYIGLGELFLALGVSSAYTSAIGFFSAAAIASTYQDKIYKALKKKNGGNGQPEYRVRHPSRSLHIARS
jgi:hypothetical protein